MKFIIKNKGVTKTLVAVERERERERERESNLSLWQKPSKIKKGIIRLNNNENSSNRNRICWFSCGCLPC